MHPAEPDPEALEFAAQALARARRALFITGAGLSAESGLPTYRGVGGLYNQPAPEEGLPIEELLSGHCLREDPATCWRYIAQIERACRGAKPNVGHDAIAALEQAVEQVVVLTQNVDGFHLQAGSTQVIEMHGNLHGLRCTACRWRDEVMDYASLQLPPACPDCGSLVRPEVVLFGEALPLSAVSMLDRELRQGFDVVLSVGTTSVFPYICDPVIRARHHGVATVEINPGETQVSRLVDRRIQTKAGAVLDQIRARVQEIQEK